MGPTPAAAARSPGLTARFPARAAPSFSRWPSEAAASGGSRRPPRPASRGATGRSARGRQASAERSPFVELGLPPTISACLFDLDGVLTQTAKVHAQAWKQTFDEFLRTHSGQAPFDVVSDYDQYVDGKPREDGVRSFLDSRRIAYDETHVHELASRKD